MTKTKFQILRRKVDKDIQLSRAELEELLEAARKYVDLSE